MGKSKKTRKGRGRSRSREKLGSNIADRHHERNGRRHSGQRRGSRDAKGTGAKRIREEVLARGHRAEVDMRSGRSGKRRRTVRRVESRHYATDRHGSRTGSNSIAVDPSRCLQRVRSGQLSATQGQQADKKLNLSPAKDDRSKKAVKIWGQKSRQRRRRERGTEDLRSDKRCAGASLRSAADARAGERRSRANSVALDASRCLERVKNGQLTSGQVARDDSSASASRGERSPPLPPGWQGIRDAESGDMYYWHKDNPENTTWERPVASSRARRKRSVSRRSCSARSEQQSARHQGASSVSPGADARGVAAKLRPRSSPTRICSPAPSQSPSGSSADGSPEEMMPDPSEWDLEDTTRFLTNLGLTSAAAAAREATKDSAARGFVSCISLGEAVRELLAAEDSERRHARRVYFRLMVSRGEPDIDIVSGASAEPPS